MSNKRKEQGNSFQDLLRGETEEELKDVKQIAVEKSLKELFSTRKMPMKSDLNARQITAISKGMVFSKKYNNKTMKTLIDNIMQLSVSKDRKGREEFVRLVRASQDEAHEEQAKERSMLNKILNR